MYTLDQQLKDVEEAIKVLKIHEQRFFDAYLCHISLNISKDFYDFIVRAFKRMDKISPKAFHTTVRDPLSFTVSKLGLSPAIWDGEDFDSRFQFLTDLKEDIIENG